MRIHNTSGVTTGDHVIHPIPGSVSLKFVKSETYINACRP